MRLSEILSEGKIVKTDTYYRLYYSSKYKKAIKRLRSKHALLKKIDQIEDDLKEGGELTNIHAGVHPISNQTLHSEYKNADLRGWKSVVVSMKDEVRLVFLLHDEEIHPKTKKPFRVVEIKLGKPKEIGYSH